MIYVTGDLHGSLDISKFNTTNFPQGYSLLTKNDYVIILGDFGLIWGDTKQERYWLNWLNTRPWTTLFLDGNHENFERLYQYPVEKKFGGKVTKIADFIYHLRRGEIYDIDGNKIFTFGGATSIDKASRTEHISWWKEEVPNYAEMKYGLNNLVKHDSKVDYILTHTCNKKIADKMKASWYQSLPASDIEDPTVDYLTALSLVTHYKKWYFGHWHDDYTFDEYHTLLYLDIIPLGKDVVKKLEKVYNI
jgi:hypothetical protein